MTELQKFVVTDNMPWKLTKLAKKSQKPIMCPKLK